MAARIDEVAEGVVEVTFTVEPNYAGWRLDRYLCEKIRRLSRVRVQRILRTALVTDHSTQAQHPGVAWPHVSPPPPHRSLEPKTPDDLREVYRDEALLVLDKPAGLPIHPTARYHHGTVVALLRRQHGPGLSGCSGAPSRPRDFRAPGLRTDGGSVAAADARLPGGRACEKEYLAIVEGWPAQDAFAVDAPLLEGTPTIRIAVRVDAARTPCPDTLPGGGALPRARANASRSCAAFRRPDASIKSGSTSRRQASRWWGTRCTAPTPATSTASAGTASSPRRGCASASRGTPCTRRGLSLPHPRSGKRAIFTAPLPADLASFLPRVGGGRPVRRLTHPGRGREGRHLAHLA